MLRELDEEVWLRLDGSATLRLLDVYATRSGYVMTLVVCWGGASGELLPLEAEGAAVSIRCLWSTGRH